MHATDSRARRPLLESLVAALTRASLTPVTPAELLDQARKTLALQLADVSDWEIRSAILDLDERSDISRDTAGRLYAKTLARSARQTLNFLNEAERIAGAVADTDAP